jgi:hypothetical protein
MKVLLTIAIIAIAFGGVGTKAEEHRTYLPLVQSGRAVQDWRTIPTPPPDCGYPAVDVHVWTCINGTPVPGDD